MTHSAAPLAFLAFLALSPLAGPAAAAEGEWRHYAADKASTKYSPLDQIDRDNVGKLELAWSWANVDDQIQPPVRGAGHFKATPVMVGGKLYFTTALQQVVAVDAGTGKTIWVNDPKVHAKGRPVNSGFQHRGVEYWSDGTRERLFVANGLRQLLSIDAATGQLDPQFGSGGIVDTTVGLSREIKRINEYGHNAPPIVCGGTLVLGSIVSDGPTRQEMPPGDVRGYDPVTGALRWTFHTIPQQGELGVETWENDAWKVAGNTNVWSMLSCDDELGMVYLPLSTPTNDWYGGHRKGDNLFAESLVALDAKTGLRKWHFQAVHHGLWDYDFPAAPNLVDIEVAGKKIPAIAQVSKQGFTYVFDRRTGEPVWPIEERPVPQSDVPGEKTSPTQPFPTKPPPFESQGITEQTIIDFTPELRAEAMKILENYRIGPIFTPPVAVTETLWGNVQHPGWAGGANWGGAAFDPDTARLFVPSFSNPTVVGLVKPDPARSDFDWVRGHPQQEGLQQGAAESRTGITGPRGLPIVKPPYGRVTAYDLSKGDIAWQVPHGEGLRQKIIDAGAPDPGPVGSASFSGPLLTKTLLFLGQGAIASRVAGEAGSSALTAYDKATGEVVANVPLPARPSGTPMSYVLGGKQYIVVATGGGPQAGLLALALP